MAVAYELEERTWSGVERTNDARWSEGERER